MDFKKSLDTIYEMIPNSEPCIEGCSLCCSPINWTPVEEEFISKYMIEHDIEKVTWGTKELAENNWKCPYLNKESKCKIYDVRPLVCRMMGHTENLICPKHEQSNLSKKTLDKITRDYMKINEKYIEYKLFESEHDTNNIRKIEQVNER
jgi:Fe-S-cluster containining protein